MGYYALKIAITTLLVVIISEVARRSTLMGAVLASVPIVSVLAIFWLYVDTKDLSKISHLASSIFWLVLPSLALFLCLPLLLKSGVNFYLSMALSIALTVICYWAMLWLLHRFGIRFLQ